MRSLIIYTKITKLCTDNVSKEFYIVDEVVSYHKPLNVFIVRYSWETFGLQSRISTNNIVSTKTVIEESVFA